jgi:hypothetical protein
MIDVCSVQHEYWAEGYIYYNWKKVSDVFNGIKGAKAKKFHSLEEAPYWLELQQEGYDEQRDRNQVKAMEIGQQAQMEADEARELPKSVQKKISEKYQSGPPSVLLGADPSMKDGETVYGVDVSTGEAELRATLCPLGMTENVAKGLTNAMIDMAALPGGFARSGGAEEANDSELTFIGAALEEMAHQGRGGTVESVGQSAEATCNGEVRRRQQFELSKMKRRCGKDARH